MSMAKRVEAFVVIQVLRLFLGRPLFGYILTLVDFLQRRDRGRRCAVKSKNVRTIVNEIMDAVDYVLGPPGKTPQCLLRSCAGFFMLRLRRIPVKLNIGVKVDPFRAHAWLYLDEPLHEYIEDISSYRIVF